MASEVVLRDYQKVAVNNVLQAISDGIRRPAVVLATGGGKTVVLSSLIPKLRFTNPKRRKILVLAHKEELIRQLHGTISRMNPQLNVQIDMQKSIPTADADVIVGSVMTLVRLTRLHRYDPREYGAIIFDECHHAVATSWTKILNYFGALENDSEMLVLGFTATLERSDGKKLAHVFENIVFQRTLRTMIEKKELCDIKFSTIKTSLDLKGVRMSNGDFSTPLLSKAVNVDDVNLQVVRAFIQLRKEAGFKSTLIFCVDIDHCKTLCGVLQANGVNAQYVTGETVKYERQAILEDFKNGKIDVLCNVLVFTEGTDIPNIDSLILARPTKSRPLLVQMIGRGLRLHQGKLYCHIIDIVSTVAIGVLSVPTLFGVDKLDDIEGKTLLDLEKEIDEEKKKTKEKARQREIAALLEVQQRLKGLDLDIETIDGFAELEKDHERSTQNVKETNQTFKSSRHKWVRLEYNVWGLNSPFSDQFFAIERVMDEDNTAKEFKLYDLKFTPRAQIIASDFKAKRRLSKLITSGTLPHVLSVASNNSKFYGEQRTTLLQNKPISDKQSKWLLKNLLTRVQKEYGPSAVIRLHSALSKLTSLQASELIFAIRYSQSCLFVKWQIEKMMKGMRKVEVKGKVEK